MNKRMAFLTAALLVVSAALTSQFAAETTETNDEDQLTASTYAADPPHNITHFLHTGETARYFSPQFSVLNYFNTEVPLDLTGAGRNYSGQEQFAMQWYMYPSAGTDLTISGIDAVVWISGEVGTGQPNMAGSLEIFEVTEADILNLTFNGTLVYLYNIPSNTPLYTYPPSAPMVFPMEFNYTFQTNSTIRFVLTINPGTSGGGVGSQYTNVTVFWDSYHMFDSRLVIHTENPMTIDSINTMDFERNVVGGFIDEGNTTMYFSANISDPYGGYDVKWVNLTVYDKEGMPILSLIDAPMVRVSGSDISALLVYELAWNYTGFPTGIYSYSVWAVDNAGYIFYHYFGQYTFSPYDETCTDEFSIGVMFELSAHVVDTLDAPLDGALVWYDGLTTYSNDTGWVDMIVFGNGTLRVYWHGVIVHESSVDVFSTPEIHVTCDVYYPELIILDSKSVPLQSAAVFFAYPDGEALPALLSDAEGSVGVLSQVPIGESPASVWWRGSVVFDGTVTIDHNGATDVKCEVYYMGVHVTDWAGTPITMATVSWMDSNSHILIDAKFVNETGWAVARLPVGTYDIEVYWHGNLIASVSEVPLSGNMDILVVGQVCTVDILAVDARNIPLADAHVVISSASEVILSDLTNEAGAVHTVLPIGDLNIKVYWLGALVNETDLTLTDNASIVMECSVSYLTVTAVDAGGNYLSGVEVVIKDAEGNAIAYGETVEGQVGFRLPDQDVVVQGHLVDEYLMTHVDQYIESDVTVTGDAQVTLTFDDYPPSFVSTIAFILSMLGVLAAVLAVLLAFILLKARRKNPSGPPNAGDETAK